MSSDVNLVIAATLLLIAANFGHSSLGSNPLLKTGLAILMLASLSIAFAALWIFKSKEGRRRKKLRQRVGEVPVMLQDPSAGATLGRDRDSGILVTLPNSIRMRHTHILGATGAGKTESVILNLLGQDIAAGSGAIILDGKGDDSFVTFLAKKIPPESLFIFDLSDESGASYDPLRDGSGPEAAQRLFSSLNWSEEYYKSKASAALQRIFHLENMRGVRPTIPTISSILSSAKTYRDAVAGQDGYSPRDADSDYQELSGLKDQVSILSSGGLKRQLGGGSGRQIDLAAAYEGKVIYFRLQSLLSRQLASMVGRLVINNLSYLAGSAHRNSTGKARFVPVYLDEFATFACPEFADLISKARSAGFALHFSHQSVGDLEGVKDGFLSQIMDNSATKIVLRINDPDTAEILSRTFGTQKAERVTKRVSNATDLDLAESDGMGSLREVREFRASPDLLKTLPTGMGAVLIAHGEDTPHGASTVFQVHFPRLSF